MEAVASDEWLRDFVRAKRVRREGRGEREEMVKEGRGSQVWQGKDLREYVFGSVAMIGLTGWFFGCVARKRLRRFLVEAEDRERGVRKAAGRGRIKCRVAPAKQREG